MNIEPKWLRTTRLPDHQFTTYKVTMLPNFRPKVDPDVNIPKSKFMKPEDNAHTYTINHAFKLHLKHSLQIPKHIK